MKDFINDKLILLAAAQESMADVADKMINWDKSQFIMEKSAFESMNISDDMLRLSREGSVLVGRLLECCKELMKHPSAEANKKMAVVLDEIHSVFENISDTSANVSEISHRIEGEAAVQKEIEEDIKKSLVQVSKSLDSAIACAELILAEKE